MTVQDTLDAQGHHRTLRVCDECVPEQEVQGKIAGVRLELKPDNNLWLHITAKNGNACALNINSIMQDRGVVSRQAYGDWLKDITTNQTEVESGKSEISRLNSLLIKVREAYADSIVEVERLREAFAASQETAMNLRDELATTQGEKGECIWKADEDGVYWTSCDNGWCFDVDGPKENGAKYCPYCGKTISTTKPEGEVEKPRILSGKCSNCGHRVTAMVENECLKCAGQMIRDTKPEGEVS